MVVNIVGRLQDFERASICLGGYVVNSHITRLMISVIIIIPVIKTGTGN